MIKAKHISPNEELRYSFGNPDPRIIGKRVIDGVVANTPHQPDVLLIAGIPATEYPTSKYAIVWKNPKDKSTYIACLRKAGRDHKCVCCGEKIKQNEPNIVRIRLHPEEISPYNHFRVGHFDITNEPGDIRTA